MTLTNDQLENRVIAIETVLNSVQAAINKLATKAQLNALLNIRQSEIIDHEVRILTLESQFTAILADLGITAPIVPPTGGTGGTGWIYVSDVTPQGGGNSVDNKIYQDASSNVLQSCRTSSLSVNINIRASFPLVTIAAQTFELTASADGGHFEDNVTITLGSSGEIELQVTTSDDEEGATDTFTIALETSPAISTAIFISGYPGAQTELKAGDTYQIQVTANKAFDQVTLYTAAGLATDAAVISVLSGTLATITATVADQGNSPQLLPARVSVRGAVGGAESATFDTDSAGVVDGTNVINLNNLAPSISISTVTYPATQSALKNSETATIANTLSNFDTVVYDSPNADLNVTLPTTSENPKTVTRIAGSYNVSVNNIRIVANRAANDTTTTAQAIVNIANVAAVTTVTYPGARIRSGSGVGEDTLVTMSFDQNQLSAPAMDPVASRGTFQGAGFVGSGTSWTRTIRVLDSENPADNSSNSWANLIATNLAGIVTSVITVNPSYIVGGFSQRTMSIPAFLADTTELIPLTTEGNLLVGSFSNGNVGVIQPFGTSDTTDIGKEGWVAPTGASGSVNLHMLHSPTAAAHSGILNLTLVEETA